jgi:hypothetical protein
MYGLLGRRWGAWMWEAGYDLPEERREGHAGAWRGSWEDGARLVVRATLATQEDGRVYEFTHYTIA